MCLLLWNGSRTPAVEPNHGLLQSALDQTEGAATHDAARWRDLVMSVLNQLDVHALRDDVAPFLEQSSDADLLTVDHLRAMLES
ncbi:hypothetical protein ACFL6X_04770 [Candidatus Latescibacterota bacterium]